MLVQIFGVRVKKWNDSIGADDSKRKDKLIDVPECKEQVFHEQLVPVITRELVNAVGDEFDDEFKEIDKAEADKKRKDKKEEKKEEKKKPKPESEK